MRIFIVGFWLASTLAAEVAVAQQAPFNEAGVTMGHWHLVSHDVAANKKIFVAMGGTPVTRGTAEGVRFPGARVNLNLGEEPPEKGGSVGSVINHVGLTPDGVRIEILEDKTQTVPIQHEHVHFFLLEAEIPKAVAWYAKIFGGKVGTRNNQPVVDVPGGQLRFAKVDTAQAPTRGRVLDHIGFDVKDLPAFIKKIGPRASSSTSRTARSWGPARRSPTSPTRGARASSWSSLGCEDHDRWPAHSGSMRSGRSAEFRESRVTIGPPPRARPGRALPRRSTGHPRPVFSRSVPAGAIVRRVQRSEALH